MKLLKTLIIAVCMLVCVFQAFSSGGREDKDEILVFDGKITYLEGKVYLNGDEAETGDKVANNDLIVTESDSFCEVVFNERNIIQIGPESSFRTGKRSYIEFTLEKGSLSAVADRIEKAAGKGDRLRVNTPSAVMGIRGTLFFIKVEGEDKSYLCLCKGKASTYKGDGSSRRVLEADHHKATRFIRSGDSYKRESAGLLYHDDESMERLAEKIGIKVVWGSGKAY